LDSPSSPELSIEPEEYDRDVLRALLGNGVLKTVREVVSEGGGMQIFIDAATWIP